MEGYTLFIPQCFISARRRHQSLQQNCGDMDSLYVCVCVCVREGERERERQSVCVCVRVVVALCGIVEGPVWFLFGIGPDV